MNTVSIIRGSLLAGLFSLSILGAAQPASASIFDDIGHAAGNVVKGAGKVVTGTAKGIGKAASDVGDIIVPPKRVEKEKMGSVTYIDYAPKKTQTQAQPQQQTKAASNFCPSGLVWRERFDGDTVCVLPGERDENRRKRGLKLGAASLCPSGLVWRERFDGDTVCVTPIERDENRRRRGL